MLGFPAESTVKFFLAGDEHGWIAGAARRNFTGDFATGDFLGSVDDFENREAAAVANVEGFA